MEDICTGCLCSGRRLSFIGDTGFYQLYSQILNETSEHEVSQICIRICWECCALLLKFQHFKEQVKRNYSELLWNAPPPSYPPHITTTPVFILSYPDQAKVSVKDEYSFTEDIKTEAEEESTEHQEPVTFVNDLSVEPDVDEPMKKTKKKPKEKKPSKNKIKVKKKKKAKQTVPESKNIVEEQENIISDCISDTDLLAEDSFQEDDDRPLKSINKEVEKEDKVSKEDSTNVPSEVPKENKQPVQPSKASVQLLPEKPQCAECGKTFSSRKTYRYHLNVLHKGNNRYPCPRCGKIYQWKSNLGRHMRTHKAVDAGELYCEECDKSFASVATYRQHLRISRRHVSENEFSFTCNECGKKFVNKTRLRDHIDWEHLKKIKFRCQLCNKPFKCHTSLYVHLQNVHRNKEKKDNLCHVCGKSYQNAAKLKYHIIALHTGETPYQCSQCSAAFGWYSSLYRHIREVHYKVKTQSKKAKRAKKSDTEPQPYINYLPSIGIKD